MFTNIIQKSFFMSLIKNNLIYNDDIELLDTQYYSIVKIFDSFNLSIEYIYEISIELNISKLYEFAFVKKIKIDKYILYQLLFKYNNIEMFQIIYKNHKCSIDNLFEILIDNKNWYYFDFLVDFFENYDLSILILHKLFNDKNINNNSCVKFIKKLMSYRNILSENEIDIIVNNHSVNVLEYYYYK